jgi:hypothetical protein
MREAIRRGLVSRVWLGLAFSVTAAIGFAQPPDTTFYLDGIQGKLGLQGYSIPGTGGILTSPYLADIGGSSVGTNVICDDFADDSYVPEEWDAYVTTMSPSSYTISNGGYLKWSGATVTGLPALSQQQAYETAALLTEDILTAYNSSGPSGNAAIYSYALWGLFDPYGNGNPSDAGAFGTLSPLGTGAGSDFALAQADLLSAANTVLSQGGAALNGATVTIYTYDAPDTVASHGGPWGCNGSCPPPPQEFITVSNMPEPSSVAILGADLFAVAGLVFFLRRRRMVRS